MCVQSTVPDLIPFLELSHVMSLVESSYVEERRKAELEAKRRARLHQAEKEKLQKLKVRASGAAGTSAGPDLRHRTRRSGGWTLWCRYSALSHCHSFSLRASGE